MMSLHSAQQAISHGRFDEAERIVRNLINKEGPSASALAMLGFLSLKRGEANAAVSILERSIETEPRIPMAWCCLAEAQLSRGEARAARAAAERASSLDPRSGLAVFFLAQAVLAEGDESWAEREFERARALDPHTIDLRFDLGNAAFDRNQPASAAAHYRACVRARPDWAEAWFNLGLSEYRQSRLQEGLVAMTRVCSLDPGHCKAHRWKAAMLDQSGATAEPRLAAWRAVVVLEPSFAPGHLRLGLALRDDGRYAQARDSYSRAATLDVRLESARFAHAMTPESAVFVDDLQMSRFRDDWLAGVAHVESWLDRDAPTPADVDALLDVATPFHLGYLGEPLVDEHRRFAGVLRRVASHAHGELDLSVRKRPRSSRRRIGIVSSSLGRHSVSKLFRHALMALADQHFDLRVFALHPQQDPWIDAWQGRCEVARDATDAGGWRERILAADLDVLLCTDYGLDPLLQGILPFRLAPVQALLWGHPVTSGLASVDWFLSSETMEPDAADAHYTECLHRLPGLGACFDYDDIAPRSEVSESLLPEGRPRLYCAQSYHKLLPVHDRLFAQILRAVPGATLLLSPNAPTFAAEQLRQRMRAGFDAEGVDFDSRCHLFEKLDESEAQGVLAASDIVLDSLHWSGGVTSLEAFWLNKPVITMPGRVMRSRHTAGMLALMDMPELIADDPDHYVRLAISLGEDLEARRAAGQRVAERKGRLYRDRQMSEALARFLAEVVPP
jgi:protein O-GlcNAc transferase